MGCQIIAKDARSFTYLLLNLQNGENLKEITGILLTKLRDSFTAITKGAKSLMLKKAT